MWELTVVNEARLRGVNRHMIWIMCGMGLIDRVTTDVLGERVGVVCKLKIW